jgi:hypothetical protein
MNATKNKDINSIIQTTQINKQNEHNTMDLTITKRYVIESVNDPFVIEFTDEQDIYDDEQYGGMDAYECYMSEDNEVLGRAVYYYNTYTGEQYLLYKEQDEIKKIKIYRILPIEDDETIEEAIDKADEGNGLTMGDIC